MLRGTMSTPRSPLRRRLCLLALLPAVAAAPAAASNGLNMIGFGNESVLMAGADTAAARDTSSLNTNPAGLARIGGSAFDVYSAAAFALDNGHADRFGNDISASNRVTNIAGGGFARRLGGAPVVAGVGFFVQGGAGAVYKDLATPFGGRDELSALTGILKVAPGLAWQPNERLAVGAALALTYARSTQKTFPNTSAVNPANPSQAFFGTELRDADALRAGVRVGVQYAPREDLRLGAVYSSRVPLPLRGGNLTVNFDALGLGRVRYDDVRADGLALPREISIGAAWQADAKTLLALKLSRLYWSDAISTLVLDAGNPDSALAPAQLRSEQRLNWHDRTVIAFGIRRQLGEASALLAGFNYSRRPMDDDTLNPVFAPIGQKHLTLGLTHCLNREYELSAGLEYQLRERVTFTNPQLPFGSDTQTRLHYLALHAMLSRRW
jgi:long-chain fatty acid transport protein